MSKDKFERRLLLTSELRATPVDDEDDDDAERSIAGYAARFNQLSVNLGGFKERVSPGAFNDIIDQQQDVVCLFNHDANVVLGRTKSGTLKLSQDKNGLRFTCSLPKTQAARDLYQSVARGDVAGCSFSFNMSGDPSDEMWQELPDDSGSRFTCRTLVRVASVHDVGPVVYPAYPSTDVAARSAFIEQVNVTQVVIPKNLNQFATDSYNARVQRRRDLLHQV